MASSAAFLTPRAPRAQPLTPSLGATVPRPRLRTAVVLPSGSTFSAAAPNSMETVVRTLTAAMPDEDVFIFCDRGARDHGCANVWSVKADGDRPRALIDALRTFEPDIVEHHQQVKSATVLARALPEAAHVLYRHNALKPPRHPVDAWRYNARYGAMDGFVFVSGMERARFAHAYPALADRAWAVPNPIDPGPWLASPDVREPVIAFAGRAMAEKGLAEVCAALPSILDRHRGWRAVLMLGDWMDHQKWASPRVAPLRRYGDRVEILHSADLAEVQRRMKTAAIALTPSLWDEPFGLTAIEAHAAGAALISSGRGGLREASGPHAHYLTEVTARALTTAIDDLISQPNRRATLARAAQAFVLDVHAPAKRAAELRDIRRAVVERRHLAARTVLPTWRS